MKRELIISKGYQRPVFNLVDGDSDAKQTAIINFQIDSGVSREIFIWPSPRLNCSDSNTLGYCGIVANGDEGQLWFCGGPALAGYYRYLIPKMKDIVGYMKVEGGFKTITALIDPEIISNKKFAKLAGLHYSRTIVAAEKEFEEWEF